MLLSKNIKKLFAFNFLREFGFIGGILVPFFTIWGGLEMWQVMALQSWFMICIFLFEVPTGVVADYWGRKQSLILGSLFISLGAFLYIIQVNFLWFLLCEALWALGVALISGADEAIVYDTLREEKREHLAKKVFGFFENTKLIAIAISAPAGSILAKFFGLRAPFLAFSIFAFFAFIVALTLEEPKNFKNRKETKRYLDILKTGFNYLYKHKVLWRLALDFIVIYLLGYLVLWFYQKKLISLELDIVYFGFIHLFFTLSQVIFIHFSSKIEILLKSKKRLIFLTSFLTGILLIILGFFNNLYIIVPAIILISAFSLGRKPLFTNYFNQQITIYERATVLSAISMLQKMILAITIPIFGYLVGFSLNYVFISLGVFAILFAFISRVKEEHLIN